MNPSSLFAVESDPVTSDKPESVTSDKPESTGWLDVDDDDTCSEASFCSAVSHLAVGPGADKLEQDHITSAHSFDICDDTTLPSSYRVLPTGSRRDLECGLLYPDYGNFSGERLIQYDGYGLSFGPKLWSEHEGRLPLQPAVMIDENRPASMSIFASPIQDRSEQTYKEQVLVVCRPFPPTNFRNLLTGHSETSNLWDWRQCSSPRHIVVEHHNPNVGRGKCFR
ncbi:uncharacterized protein FMAN_07634 [Fusarium mangiferae]|uniref:Uncharacterized protein n=1 Tax=Fusarium mangiferae TaxID=192010 RepID=A0A1L7TBV7_FUSMA|nr:uncharacterized protein FMAN_07634 [Fusarium mangiferae]CVK92791.1 uncharacterized protein FMAN_07634 [Fusarium mangiferae]